MNTTLRMLTALLKNALFGADISSLSLSEEDAKALFRLSSRHDLTHIVGNVICKNDLLPKGDLRTRYEKAAFNALFRYRRLASDLDLLCRLFEKEQIPFMPLKGSVIRNRYPEPWMRTSCDIDILVKEENLAQAKALLIANGFREDMEGSHDISLFSPQGTHIELHFRLMENYIAKGMDLPLADPWANATPVCEGSYRYAMTDAMFYYYHIAHMAKHYLHGGCGIRPFIDLYFLSHGCEFDKEARASLLAAGGLTEFAAAAEKLTAVWLLDGTPSAISESMEEFLLSGGVYGTKQNRITIQQAKRGGKIGYAFSRIFLPYEILKFHYPVLQKHKWLLPVCEVRRWGKLIFLGGLHRSAEELRLNQAVENAEKEKALLHLKELGLS